MTRAVLYRTKAGRYFGYQISDHAGYDEEGHDIVCAAVSFLATTICNALEAVIGVEPVNDSDPSVPVLRVFLPARLDNAQEHDAQVLLRALHQGMIDLHEAYADNFTFSIHERRETP